MGVETHALGASLGPALIQHCHGRLSTIEWFRSTWQHGGAATGFARWRRDDGAEIEVLVKVPVGPVEYRWTTQLSDAAESLNGFAKIPGASHLPTPRVLASADGLGEYDLAWLVMERLQGPTLTHGWCRESLESLLWSAALMQAKAEHLAPVGAAPAQPDWEGLIHKARDIARASELPEAQHWNESVKHVQRHLPRLEARWAARPINAWCHGDLHPGNAMRRDDGGPCVLIDLALTHAGHWVEDAVYLERQFWGHAQGLFGVHPVSLLAKYRRELGVTTEGDYGALANVRRVLMAACAPVYLEHEGNSRYLHAALETIDKVLPQVAH
jgi:aminoglycoside phosphotransferase (APT) family kinase protein